MIAFADSMKIARDDSEHLENEIGYLTRSGANKWVSERTRAQRSSLALSETSCVEQASESLVRANELANVRVVRFHQILTTSVLHSLANSRGFLKNRVKRLRNNVSHSVSPRSLWCCDFCFIFDAYLHAAWRKMQKNRIGTKFVPNTVRIFLPWMLSYFGLRFCDRKKQRIKRDAVRARTHLMPRIRPC